jgi:proline dehydrogenase
LEAATEQRLVKTVLWILMCVCVIINSKMWSRAVSKNPINPIINPKLSIVTLHTRDNISEHIGEAPIFGVGIFIFSDHFPMMDKPIRSFRP